MNDETTAAAEPSANARTVSVDEAIALALEYVDKRWLADAAGLLETIVEHIPDHVDALNNLGLVRCQMRAPEVGLELLLRAAALAPMQAGIQNNIGNVHMEMGDIKSAAAAYSRAIELNPEEADAYGNLASIARHTGEIPQAERLLRKAIELEPNFGVAYHNLGTILLADGRAADAIDLFWKATTLMADKGLPAHFLGLAYWVAGMKDVALRFVNGWCEDHPDDLRLQHMRAAMSGENIPDRASDLYVRHIFDSFASSFDAKLEMLQYRAPELIGEAVSRAIGKDTTGLAILDAGCGTGLCATYLKPHASSLDGVDLSAGMLEKAQKRGGYDRLLQAELTEFLSAHPGRYDVVASADTLCYFGRLQEFASAAASAIRRGGVLAFTVEKLETSEEFHLQVNGRYRHSAGYVRKCVEDAGLSIEGLEDERLRFEGGVPVEGIVVTARKPSGD